MCELRSGDKCKVCTRCGRCPGVLGDITVITESILADEPLFGKDPMGRLIVVDLGTTSIAIKALGSEGRQDDIWSYVNPQMSYGRDVISRIRHGSSAQGLKELQEQVQKVIEKTIEEYAEGSGLGKAWSGRPDACILAGNTTMSYLFRGIDPTPLGRAPFEAKCLKTRSIEVAGVDCLVLPGLSAFVGGDIVAGIYATGMHEREEISLLIDMGTNGEMVLGNRHRMVATATACGPAFEGDRSQKLFGSELIKCVAELLRLGIVDETGLLEDEFFEEGITIGGYRITQEHIRNLQLAKSAIASGIHILLKEMGIAMMDVRSVYLAGGMGFFLDGEAAASIGLIPMGFLGRTVTAGNTSLLGAEKLARKGLLSVTEIERELSPITSGLVEVINLAEYPGFDREYLENCSLGVDRWGTL